MYEGGHRVPAIVWAPSRVKPGSISNQTMMTFDIMVSSINLAGAIIPKKHKMDGVNIYPAIFNNKRLDDRTVIWEWSKDFQSRGALRKGSWKLVIQTGKPELYNLDNDPKETKNLASFLPGILQGLHKEYRTIFHEISKN